MLKLNKQIIELLQKPVPRLIFSLVCGLAYFIIVMQFVNAYTEHAMLMGLFIAPLVIAGGAYVIVVMLRKALEDEEGVKTRSVMTTFYMNICILLVAILLVISNIIVH